MKTIFRFLAIIAVGLAIFAYQNGFTKTLPFLNQSGQAIDSQDQKVLGDSAQMKEISLPAPLQVKTKWLSSEATINLTSDGVVKYANIERIKEGRAELDINEKLNASAKIKLDDMFKEQYFEHTSPEGFTISDLGQEVGYDYILLGENLAMGDFKDDRALVLAWMESPKHRENILNNRYTEIGVAVGQGMYDGKMTWLAVEHFGRPADLCPGIDQNLKTTIDQNKARIDELALELNLSDGGAGAIFLAYMKDFSEVREYNKLIEETANEINLYNNQVASFNNCIQN